MRSFADAFVALTFIAVLAAVPIVGVSLAQNRIDELTSTEPNLTQRVADAFNDRFGALYTRNPLDGRYEPLPAVKADEFRLVADDDHFTRLVREPPAGMTVHATIDKTSGLIAFAKPAFAYD